jgi:hypothetical protein
MAATINFANVPRVSGVTIATANTNRDGTGTLGTVITAGTNGTRIDRIRAQAIVTTTAGRVRLFLYDGVDYYALEEMPITAATVSATVSGAFAEIAFGDVRPLTLPAGWSIAAGTHNANDFVVTAYGADF